MGERHERRGPKAQRTEQGRSGWTIRAYGNISTGFRLFSGDRKFGGIIWRKKGHKRGGSGEEELTIAVVQGGEVGKVIRSRGKGQARPKKKGVPTEGESKVHGQGNSLTTGVEPIIRRKRGHPGRSTKIVRVKGTEKLKKKNPGGQTQHN